MRVSFDDRRAAQAAGQLKHRWSRRELMRLSCGLLAGATLLPKRAVAGAPRRVVTLFQGATDTAVALGVTPCGVVDSWSEKPMYRYLRAALDGVPHVGLETQPSLEDIALLAPDLIVASRFRHERIAGLLSRLCPVVMMEEVFEFRETLARMGEALAMQGQANALQADWDHRISLLRMRLQTHFGNRWPVTGSVVDMCDVPLRSYSPSSFAGSVLGQLGFRWNATMRGVSGVSLKISNRESLPAVNADLFFVFGRAGSPLVQRQYASLQEHPLWQRLDAQRAGEVWWVDGVAWILSGGILGANRMLDDIERTVLRIGAT